jgi:hypothetical protein
MSTSSPVPDQNDPRINAPIEVADDPSENYKSPHARALHAIGMTVRGKAREFCRRFKRQFRCRKGTVIERYKTCHQRFCVRCARERLAQFFRQYRYKLEHIQEVKWSSDTNEAKQFVYLELDIPHARDKAMLKATAKSIRKALRKLHEGSKSTAQLVSWLKLAGFIGDTLRVRIIYWGKGVTPEALRAALPNVSTLTFRDNWEIFEYFKVLADAMIPKSPTECAEMEKLFDGVKQLHTIGTWHSEEKTADTLLPGTLETQGSNVLEALTNGPQPNPKCPLCRPTCHCCHEKVVQFTDYFDSEDPEAKVQWHNFTDLPKVPRQRAPEWRPDDVPLPPEWPSGHEEFVN